jgi:hypothetical protein
MRSYPASCSRVAISTASSGSMIATTVVGWSAIAVRTRSSNRPPFARLTTRPNTFKRPRIAFASVTL